MCHCLAIMSCQLTRALEFMGFTDRRKGFDSKTHEFHQAVKILINNGVFLTFECGNSHFGVVPLGHMLPGALLPDVLLEDPGSSWENLPDQLLDLFPGTSDNPDKREFFNALSKKYSVHIVQKAEKTFKQVDEANPNILDGAISSELATLLDRAVNQLKSNYNRLTSVQQLRVRNQKTF